MFWTEWGDKMIPEEGNTLIQKIASELKPSLTFSLDGGMLDGLAAVRQAVYLVLNTERYDFLIFSWNYGIEMKNLIGREKEYVYPELRRSITEALLQDDRIKEVTNFEFSNKKEKIAVSFTVHSIFGDFSAEKEGIAG